MSGEHVEKTATLSEDGFYRHDLTRIWEDPYGPRLCWVMLNPSTADHEVDDPTIRRCMAFSKAWGYHSLTVVNLFDMRATNPADLRDAAEAGVRPWSDACDLHIELGVLTSDAVIAGWGTKGDLFGRNAEVIHLITRHLGENLWCLDTTKDGHPKHPLYVKGDTPSTLFRAADPIVPSFAVESSEGSGKP